MKVQTLRDTDETFVNLIDCQEKDPTETGIDVSGFWVLALDDGRLLVKRGVDVAVID